MATFAIIGAGPAGLMAAEVLAGAGQRVLVFDAMPSIARKFLMAGKSGLNLTHSEAPAAFLGRYGAASARLAPALSAFGAAEVRAWAAGLGIDTFVGSSGRVFPSGMKAAPLLRAWQGRLRQLGVRFHMRHRWLGFQDAAPDAPLRFATPDGPRHIQADATLLALGGASWPQLGSDGRWAATLAAAGIALAPFRPANCAFRVAWSAHFASRHAGQPLKNVGAAPAGESMRPGEFVISAQGVEGSLIYALAAPLRDTLARQGRATLFLDLMPGRSPDEIAQRLAQARGRDSFANHLRRRLGLTGVKAALLRECLPPAALADSAQLAAAIKRLPLVLHASAPLAEAISTAGGIVLAELDDFFMLHRRPGLFCAGEMLDWEAPTGGYLLTACLATGRQAGLGMLRWVKTSARHELCAAGAAQRGEIPFGMEEKRMELCPHSLPALFAQLGLPSDAEGIADFIARHAPLPKDVPLAAAPFWTPAQAAFLREEILEDADWAAAVEELNLRLRG